MVEDKERSVLVLGGARSGKSAFALKFAAGLEGPKTFLATAEASDAEMAERIAVHRAERGSEWAVVEEPTAIAAALKGALPDGVLLIDCLTLWLSNLLGTGLDDEAVFAAVEELAGVMAASSASVVAVSGEVGSGIVPDTALGRRFRDLAGALNRRMAEAADSVYLITAGLPLKLK